MSAILTESLITVEQDIQFHPAWIGRVSGLKAEKVLRNRKVPYLYLLRAGETEHDYYVTFVYPDYTIKHTPFVLTVTQDGWYSENSGTHGPLFEETIDHVIHSIMHCEKDECIPFTDAKKVYDSIAQQSI